MSALAAGETKLRSVYTGLVVTSKGTHVDVYLTSFEPAAEAALRPLASAGTVSFLKAPHTRLQVLAVHRLVTRDVAGLAARGIRVVTWVPGINGDGLENIGVVNLTKAHARLLRRMFGAGNVVLQNVRPGEVPTGTHAQL